MCILWMFVYLFGVYRCILMVYFGMSNVQNQEYIIEREGACPALAAVSETAVVWGHTKVNDTHNVWSFSVYITPWHAFAFKLFCHHLHATHKYIPVWDLCNTEQCIAMTIPKNLSFDTFSLFSLLLLACLCPFKERLKKSDACLPLRAPSRSSV